MKIKKFIAILSMLSIMLLGVNASAQENKLQIYLAPHIMNDVSGEIVVDVSLRNFSIALSDYYDEISSVTFSFIYDKDNLSPKTKADGTLDFIVDKDTKLTSADGLSSIVDKEKGEIEFTYLNPDMSNPTIFSDGIICKFTLMAENVSEFWNSFDKYPLRFRQGTMVSLAHNVENGDVRKIDNVEGIDTSVGVYNLQPSLISPSVNKTIAFTNGSDKVLVDGTEILTDATAYLSGGTLMVPFRYLAENIGMNVEWNGDAMLAGAYAEYKTFTVSMYNNTIYINSAKYNSAILPEERDGRIYIPIDIVTELYKNTTYNFDGQTATVYIP